jgi:hypothetical protein
MPTSGYYFGDGYRGIWCLLASIMIKVCFYKHLSRCRTKPMQGVGEELDDPKFNFNVERHETFNIIQRHRYI